MDTRRDAGEFYPGGKVISTRPLASGGDVKHSEFEDLDVKTNTIPDLREAVRELGRRLGATVVTALAACVATAATVQTVPVNDLDFDANPSVVTNVVFDAPPDFSTNNTTLVETIEAKAPTPDLSPFLRKDLGQPGWQEFGGFLSGMGFHVTHEVSNFNGWNNYTAKNGPTQPYQSLPQYIQSNPWGFALTNDFVRKTGDTMTGALTIKTSDDILDINHDHIYFSGSTGVNYIYFPDNIYGHGEIGYNDLHYRGGFDIFATREWADHWAHATVSNTVPAWARAATKPAYTAAEVGALSSAGGTLLGNLTVESTGEKSEIRAEHGNEYISLQVKNNKATIETSDYTYAMPHGDGTVALTKNIPNVPEWALAAQKPTYTASEVGATSPEAVSNIVSTAYVRKTLGVWMEYDEATGLYYYCHEEE